MAYQGDSINKMNSQELEQYIMTAERDNIIENIPFVLTRMMHIGATYDDLKTLAEKVNEIDDNLDSAIKENPSKPDKEDLADRPLDIFNYINATERIIAALFQDAINIALSGDIDVARQKMQGASEKMKAVKESKERLKVLCGTAEMYVEQRDPNRDDLPF